MKLDALYFPSKINYFNPYKNICMNYKERLRKENLRLMLLLFMNIDNKIVNISKLYLAMYKNNINHDSLGFISRMQGWLNTR